MTDDKLDNFQEIANVSQAKQQRTIMLVDDSEVDRAVYRRYLQSDAEFEYRFIEAETGEEASEIYSQFQPDVVLLDYLLPRFRWVRMANRMATAVS